MMVPRWYAAASLILVVSAAPMRSEAGQNLSDAEQGRKLFDGMCVTCHGFEGAGGDAPSLNRATLARAPDDAALRIVIRDGIPGSGMPRVRRLSEAELRQLVGYVRSLARTAPASVSGNPQNGREIYARLTCASCHIVNGFGSSLGPPLSEIGRYRGVPYLRQAIIDPDAAAPRGTMPIPGRGFGEFVPVVVVTNDGREVRGARINEDSFTIQLRDSSSKFHSFRKADLKWIEKHTDQSLMPSFKDRLTPPELDDLVAYLSSLRGQQ